MKPILLDASCVLAWLFDEPGAEKVDAVLETSFITSVNMAECVGRLDRDGVDGRSAAVDLVEAGLTVVPVGYREVLAIADLRREFVAKTSMSLGDVTCLAYGRDREMQVWTADREWAQFGEQVDLTLIR